MFGGYGGLQSPEARSDFQGGFSLALLSSTGQTVVGIAFVFWARFIRLKALWRSRHFALRANFLLHCYRIPGLATSLTDWDGSDAHMVRQTSIANIELPSCIVWIAFALHMELEQEQNY